MLNDLDMLEQAMAWKRAGHGVAVATVIKTWGSSPRPAGSLLVVRDDALFIGSVSGGCVEGEVVQQALSVMQDAPPQRLNFGVSNEQAWQAGLACGGKIDVYVAAMKLATIASLIELRRGDEPLVLITDLVSGEQRIWPSQDGESADDAEQAARVLRSDQAQLVDERQFYLPFNPPLRMLIVGAVHVAQLLVPMAQLAEYRVTVIDPRSAFASEARFGNVKLDHRWPDEAMHALGVDARTAVVVLTHDPKIDDPALSYALGTAAFYVGALGSRRTHAARLERLRTEGHSEQALARICAPIGLPIGGRSAAEIAVSILSQVIQLLRRGNV